MEAKEKKETPIVTKCLTMGVDEIKEKINHTTQFTKLRIEVFLVGNVKVEWELTARNVKVTN